MFMPKPSTDLDPIEQVFASLKHLLRKAAARTKEDVSNAIDPILNGLTAEECARYFKNSVTMSCSRPRLLSHNPGIAKRGMLHPPGPGERNARSGKVGRRRRATAGPYCKMY